MFTLRIDTRDLVRMSNSLTRFMETETIPKAGRIHVEGIRTQAAGPGFGPPDYTPAYAKKKGRSSPVNFRASGRLLDESLHVTPTGIGVESAQEGQAEGLSSKRDWMEPNDPTITAIENELAKGVDNLP